MGIADAALYLERYTATDNLLYPHGIFYRMKVISVVVFRSNYKNKSGEKE